MRFLDFSILFMSIATLLTAAESSIYLGCSQKDDQPSGIFLTSLDSATGTLAPAKRVATTENPSFLILNSTGDRLYSVAEKNVGSLVAWSVGKDGILTELNEQPAGGAGPCHLALSPSGRVLLVANYSSGSIAAFLVEKDGSLSPQTAFQQFTGSGPDASRQKEPHAHGIYCDASEKWVYVTDLGTDKVWIFRLDPTNGTLTPNDPAFASLPPGSGSRHLAFSADGKTAYINGEMGLGITSLTVDPATGGLKPMSTTPVFPPGLNLPKNADTAEVVVSKTGKTLYLSTRGYSSITVFDIASEGTLSLVENIPLPVDGPRHFSLSPDGRWLVVPGQKSNTVAVLAIDPATGRLRSTGHNITASGPMCAVFAP